MLNKELKENITGTIYHRRYPVTKISGLWIRVGFNTDPDLAFFVNVDPDPDDQKFIVENFLNIFL